MRRIISAPLLALFLTAGLLQVPASVLAAPAKATAPLQLSPNAPERYTVVRGDTLWDISGKYLDKPWRWPELWRMNKEDIKNPHWIYPGQVLVLEYDADGKPRLRVEGSGSSGTRDVKLEPKIYVEPENKAISSIPYDLIRPYLATPRVMDADQIDNLPRIVNAENNRYTLGAGDKVFVTGIPENSKRVWHIYRPGSPLKEVGSRDVLGYEAVYVGSARLIAEGNPATLQITRSIIEVNSGDRLIPEVEPEVISYMPHAPEKDIRGSVLGIYGAAGFGGRLSVISISRGAKDGVEIGHVLNLLRASRVVDDRSGGYKQTFVTPEQQTGQLFVFQVFERVSYAIIMNANDPIEPGDIVSTP